MNRNHAKKTSPSSSTSVAESTVTRFEVSNNNGLAAGSCCSRPRRVAEVINCGAFSEKLQSPGPVAVSDRYPLSCLLQLADTNVVASPSATLFRCAACQKSYSTVGGLTKHREFHCRALQQQLQQQPGGRRQPRQAAETKDQRCPQCDKAYTSASALKMHIRTHTLPCRCRLCGKAFSRPWLLQGHVRTHTGEKPFACPHCRRAFADRSNLRAHLQTHYDVKQYHCDACRRTFSRMSLLLKHRYGACAVVATDTGNTAAADTCSGHAQTTNDS